MLRNYLIVGLRNLLRHKGYTLVNILGLSIGLTCCVLLTVYLKHELSYDRHHEKADRIRRVLRTTKLGDGNEMTFPGTSGPLGPALADDFPEVEHAVRTLSRGFLLSNGEKRFVMTGCVADAAFTDVFTYPLEVGDPESIKSPKSAFITRQAAEMLYPSEDPMGQTIHVKYKWFEGDLEITGILKDTDDPTLDVLDFDFLCSQPPARNDDIGTLYGIYEVWRKESNFRPLFTYVLLREGVDASALESKLRDFMVRHMGPEVAARDAYHLQPLLRAHLYSNQDYGYSQYRMGDIGQVRTLGAIGFLIIAVACINFMNLGTARATGRAREVGLRKVVGARRSQLIAQFLGESAIVSLVALLVAIALAHAVLPIFGEFVGRKLRFEPSWDVALVLLIATLVTCVVAGAYPAAFLSAFPPSTVFRKSTPRGGRSIWQILVVVQVGVSIFLIIGTVVVYKQGTYFLDKDLGFDQEQMVSFDLFLHNRRLDPVYNSTKQAFLAHPKVLKATACANPPGVGGTGRKAVYPTGRSDGAVECAWMPIDEDFIDTFGLQLVAGRGFRHANAPENNAYVLNEVAVKRFGWASPQEALGNALDERNNARRNGPVIGVVKDFHNESLRQPIKPIAMFIHSRPSGRFQTLVLKIDTEDVSETLAFIEKTYNEFVPDRDFQFSFLDERLDRRYANVIRLTVFGVAAAVAVGIACLGLLAVVSYVTHQRTREIGVRKVLGASDGSILVMVYQGPVKLAVIGAVLVSPIAYWTMTVWLQEFAHRIEVGVVPFALGLAAAALIGAVSVGFEGIRAIGIAPADALRDE